LTQARATTAAPAEDVADSSRFSVNRDSPIG